MRNDCTSTPFNELSNNDDEGDDDDNNDNNDDNDDNDDDDDDEGDNYDDNNNNNGSKTVTTSSAHTREAKGRETSRATFVRWIVGARQNQHAPDTLALWRCSLGA